MKIKIFIVIIILLVSGCSRQALRVEDFQNIQYSNTKDLVLLNYNKYNDYLKESLVRAGFNVIKFSTADNFPEKIEAKYGIRHEGFLNANNPCITNRRSFEFEVYKLELVDLKSNNTILILSGGGKTEYCPGSLFNTNVNLFDLLASELAQKLNKPHGMAN